MTFNLFWYTFIFGTHTGTYEVKEDKKKTQDYKY